MRTSEKDRHRRSELEPRGRSVLFFLSLPVVFVALLFLSLAGCGDSGGNPAARSGGTAEVTKPRTSTPPGPPASSTPAQGTSSTSTQGTPSTTDDGGVGTTAATSPDRPAPPLTGPVSWATADSAYREGRYDDAVTLFGSYVDQHPDNPWGHYMVGLSSWKSGDLKGAEKALDETTRMDPAHGKAWVNLARVLLEEGRPDDARTAVTHALDLEPDWGEGLRVLGRVAEAQGATDEAEDAYRKAILADPQDVWSMNDLGLMRIRSGDFEGALGPLARAVQIRNDVAVFQNNLGVALERTGHYVEAREAYQRADEVADGYDKAQVSLARLDGVAEEPGVEPVELASLADGFGKTVDGWRRDRMAETPTAAEPSTTPPSDSSSGDTPAGETTSVETTAETGDAGSPSADASADRPDSTKSVVTTPPSAEGPAPTSGTGLPPED